MDINSDPANQVNSISPIIKLFFLHLVMWQLLFRVSDSAIKAITVIIKKFLSLLSCRLNSADLSHCCDDVPKSYNGLLKFVGLETCTFVVCPSCNSITLINV